MLSDTERLARVFRALASAGFFITKPHAMIGGPFAYVDTDVTAAFDSAGNLLGTITVNCGPTPEDVALVAETLVHVGLIVSHRHATALDVSGHQHPCV